MRILLVEPRNCWIGLNIALGYLAAALKKAGNEVKVLDFTNHRGWPVEMVERKFIEQFKPDLIGISLFYISYYGVKQMVGRIKKYWNGRIVIGGPQMTIERENILRDIAELDYAVVGDGEDAIVELCRAIQGEMDLSDIAGLIYRKSGDILSNRDRAIPMNIDNIPFPDYEPFGIETIRRYAIITSRGCPHRCTYCYRSTLRWRPRSPENIVEELKKAMEKYRSEEFVIVDDAFNIRPDRIEKFCDLLHSKNIRLPWSCTGVRADTMTDGLAKKMREAGCYSINIGVETLQPDLYENLNRHMSIEQVLKCIQILKKYNFRIIGYFMIGLPGETRQKTWDTYRKAKKYGIDYPRFSLLLPFPGTKMYDIIYNIPGVRKLKDYKRVSTVWSYDPEFSRMTTAFETLEYPAHEKIDMYNKLRTLEGDPRPSYHKSFIIFGLHALFWIIKYDAIHFPLTFYKLVRNFFERFLKSKGKHVFLTDNAYKESFIRNIERLTRNSSAQCAE